MAESMYFDYYYGDEAGQFTFIKIPKILLSDPVFRDLSFGAIITFSVLLDRYSLSRKNNWLDEENRVFIRYKISDLTEVMGKSEDRISNYLKELEDIGLIERSRKGLGEGKITYVKNFISPIFRDKALIARENAGNEEDQNGTIIESKTKSAKKNKDTAASKCSNDHIPRGNTGNVSRESKGNIPRGNTDNVTRENAEHNKTELNNININNTKIPYPNHINSTGNPLGDLCDDDWIRSREIIKSNIEYDILCAGKRDYEREEIDGIVDIMTEILVSRMPTFWVASAEYPAGMVKDRMLRVTLSHIEYVLRCFHANTGKIYNIKKYLLASLFNSTSTIESFYSNEVNHDLYGMN